MKQSRYIVLTAIVTLITFGGIIYTSSCRKDRCKKTTCYNGGVCQDGQCICQDGYTGHSCEVKNKSTVRYYNLTPTPIAITIDGEQQIIDTGRWLDYTRSIGDSIKGYAKSQNFNLYPLYGKQAEWNNLKYKFPARGLDTVWLRIPKEYFFVKVVNKSNVPQIRKIYVNYNTLFDSTLDITSTPPIYNDSVTNFIGYYKYYDSSRVRLEEYPRVWKFTSLGFIDTAQNKVFTAVAN